MTTFGTIALSTRREADTLPVETPEPSLRIVVALHSVLWDHADGGDERRNRSGYIADPVAPSEAKALRRDPV